MKVFMNILMICFIFLHENVRSNVVDDRLNLMPVPQKVELKDGNYRLTKTFSIKIVGHSSHRLNFYTTKVLRRLAGRTGMFFEQGFVVTDEKTNHFSMEVICQRTGKLKLFEDESYFLKIDHDKIILRSQTDIGAIRGLETFLQLLSADNDGYCFPCVEIEDFPRFPWRGLLIDVCRHFMPLYVIKRNLDAMAAVKMNVLHLHLSEDQGFRVESKTFPKLHELGSDGMYYTQTQTKEIVEYADKLGIRIVPEFDIPGHATSWLVGYPEIASAPGPYQIEREWGVKDPTLNPTLKKTYKFLEKFFKEMVTLFPDEYMHIGGDEVNGKQWDSNPQIQKYMKEKGIKNNHDLQKYFNQRILRILNKYGKKMIGWDEIFQPGLPKDIVIQSWRGKDFLYKTARKGYQGILSNGYYIDLIQPAEYHYLNDPVPNDSPIGENEKKLILGGEATMWSEYISPETIDSRIWPRTAAIAERLWSAEDVKDVNDMYRRMGIISLHLEELGTTHIKNYEMMLRRLANRYEITPLKNLTDVIEPLKLYNRFLSKKDFKSYFPLSRVVDATLPESMVARHFRHLVDEWLEGQKNDSKKYEEIIFLLNLWKNNHKQLIPFIQASPILKEIESLSSDLSTVADVGLEAIEYLQNGKKAKSAWVDEKSEIIKKAEAPRGETELMILSAIEKLVKKAGAEE